MENAIKIIRLWAVCSEWRLLYKLGGADARRRMDELSPEITRLENETGIPSRKIETAINDVFTERK